MERAQLIKKNRGPAAGYRCRRCGEPKRGHICAARMMLGEAPEGDDLHMKAAALTEISAAALKNAVDENGMLTVPNAATTSTKVDAAPTQPLAAPPARLPPAPYFEPLTATGGDDSSQYGTAGRPAPPPTLALPTPAPSTASATAAAPSHLLSTPHHLPPAARPGTEGAKSTSFVAALSAVNQLGMSENVDDFLEQLRLALDESGNPLYAPFIPPLAALPSSPPLALTNPATLCTSASSPSLHL